MKLSICIPTYNRKDFLKELIESIIREDKEKEIEICVSDNASIDGTEEMIKKFIESNVNIKYHKNSQNIGADLNYLKCVEIATGDYCWLMGSDDGLIKNSLKAIKEKINNNPDISIFLGNRIECNYNMEEKRVRKWLDENINKDIIVDFGKKEDKINYFNSSKSIGAVFSYLSSIIVKKEDWDNIKYDESYTGTYYSHVYMLLSILLKHKKLMYIINPIILCRGENDSFADKSNPKRRVFIDFKGYGRLSNLFLDKDEENSFLNILTREWGIKTLIILAVLGKEEYSNVDKELLKRIGYNKFIVDYVLNLIYYNKTFFKILYSFYKKVK